MQPVSNPQNDIPNIGWIPIYVTATPHHSHYHRGRGELSHGGGRGVAVSGAYVFCLHTPVYMQSLYIYIYVKYIVWKIQGSSLFSQLLLCTLTFVSVGTWLKACWSQSVACSVLLNTAPQLVVPSNSMLDWKTSCLNGDVGKALHRLIAYNFTSVFSCRWWHEPACFPAGVELRVALITLLYCFWVFTQGCCSFTPRLFSMG